VSFASPLLLAGLALVPLLVVLYVRSERRQPAFAHLGVRDRCVAADDAAGSLLSLPLHPRLQAGDVRRVTAAIQAFEEGRTTA